MKIFLAIYETGSYQPVTDRYGDTFHIPVIRQDFITAGSKLQVVEAVKQAFPESSKIEVRILEIKHVQNSES